VDTNPLFTLALGLARPWQVIRTAFDAQQGRLDLGIDFERGHTFACPSCTESACPVHDTVEKTWQHLDFFQHKAVLTARVPRISCPGCGVRQVAVPWARPGSGFTLLFEAYALELVRHMPVRAAAKILGVTDHRLWRMLKHHVHEALSRVDLAQVQDLGVDETSAKKGHDYITLFYDLQARRLVFVTPGKDSTTFLRFRQFLQAHGGDVRKIRHISMDLSAAFQKAAAETFPQAGVTFDHFHVTKLVQEALDQVRREQAKEHKAIKGMRWLFLRNASDLTEKQACLVGDVTERHYILGEAWKLKESFRELWRQPSLEMARSFLLEWIATAIAKNIPPMTKVAWTLWDHHMGILRWHISGVSNGVLEGLNSLIQAAKAKARGYRTHDNLITIAYLIVGKLNLPNYPCKMA